MAVVRWLLPLREAARIGTMVMTNVARVLSLCMLAIIAGMIISVTTTRSAAAENLRIIFGERYINDVGIERMKWNFPQNSLLQQVTQASFIEMEPSVTSTTLGSGIKTATISFACANLSTGEIIPNCDITLSLNGVSDDGGHAHNTNRPLGQWDPAFGNSGSDGFLESTYTSPEASGVINFLATGTQPSGDPIFPFEDTIFVRIPGLSTLVAGANFNLIGQTPTHPDNHYGTTQFKTTLVTIANTYAAKFPGNKIEYNDMSLQFGGIFDIFAGWQPPHSSHRFGNDVDVRLVPTAQRADLKSIIKGAGVRVFVEGNHWHLRR